MNIKDAAFTVCESQLIPQQRLPLRKVKPTGGLSPSCPTEANRSLLIEPD